MEARTRTQEMKYLQALGYAWGRKDGVSHASPECTRVLLTDSMAFAAWYAVNSEGATHTLEDAFEHFLPLKMDEQKRLGRESQRLAWSPYDAQTAP